MAFYDTFWWTMILSGSMVGWLVFLLGDTIRARHTPGSHGRYAWATITWAAAYPALGWTSLKLVEDMATHNRTGLVADSLLLAFWAITYAAFRRSDDDNWFRRTRNRLRTWVQDRISVLSPASAGA